MSLGILGLYLVVYLVLSVCGEYRAMGSGGLARWQEYSFWVPAGFGLDPDASESSRLRQALMKIYLPLWSADVRWFHNRHDIYLTGFRADSGEWVYMTNSWVRDVSGDWVYTNVAPATANE